MKHDLSILRGLESLLQCPVTIMNRGRRVSHKSKLFNTRFSVKAVFPYPEEPTTRILVGVRNRNGGPHLQMLNGPLAL